MRQTTPLKNPKEEEEEEEDGEEEENHGQVPDTLTALTSACNMDEFEGILSIEDDENLTGDNGEETEEGIHQDYVEVNWEDEFSATQLLEDADLWDTGFKPEISSGYWDFDEKKACLNLSLNYQEVLEAWSNRGPLWASSNTYMGEVPVMEEGRIISSRRQASVMRYKEKRQSRLFSKKIRYEVRKLNADKRPRIKGRFVKRVADKMQRGC